MKYRILAERNNKNSVVYVPQIYKKGPWYWPFYRWEDIGTYKSGFIATAENTIKENSVTGVMKEFNLP